MKITFSPMCHCPLAGRQDHHYKLKINDSRKAYNDVGVQPHLFPLIHDSTILHPDYVQLAVLDILSSILASIDTRYYFSGESTNIL